MANNDREITFKEAAETFASVGVSMEEAAQSFSNFSKVYEPIVTMESELELIDSNPNLSYLQKFFLKRKVRKRYKD